MCGNGVRCFAKFIAELENLEGKRRYGLVLILWMYILFLLFFSLFLYVYKWIVSAYSLGSTNTVFQFVRSWSILTLADNAWSFISLQFHSTHRCRFNCARNSGWWTGISFWTLDVAVYVTLDLGDAFQALKIWCLFALWSVRITWSILLPCLIFHSSPLTMCYTETFYSYRQITYSGIGYLFSN